MGTELATLAPAAGSGIGKMLADELLADPGFLPRMKDAAMGALAATTRQWDSNAKAFVDNPDYKTRLSALMGVLAHMEGDPIKRVIHQHLGGTGTVDPLAALQESPALREAAKRMLEKAEWKTSGHQASKRPKKAQSAVLEVD